MSKQNKNNPTFDTEKIYWDQGYKYIAGVDEAGCGCWAGPLVVGAVILPKDFDVDGIKDSKKLSEKKREKLYGEIMENSITWGVGKATVEEIDEKSLGKAKRLATLRAVFSLGIKPDYVLFDGYDQKFEGFEYQSIIKGDQNVLSIASASIIAKITRDRIIKKLSLEYPQYGFDRNKGYGTREHINSLEKHGVCGIHRRSYKPIKEFLNKK